MQKTQIKPLATNGDEQQTTTSTTTTSTSTTSEPSNATTTTDSSSAKPPASDLNDNDLKELVEEKPEYEQLADKVRAGDKEARDEFERRYLSMRCE